MGQVTLAGALSAGPPVVVDGTFPSMSITAPFSLLQSPKSYGVATGILTRNVNSPASFTPLQGVGATDTVTHGDFLYLKCNAQFDLRITHDDGAGGSTLVIVPVMGLVTLEFSTTKYLKLLEAKGTGQIEYFVSGQS